MQRTVLLSMLLLGIVLWSCGGQQPAAAGERSMADILVTQADQGQARQAVPGQRVLIRLDENPTTGFQWQIDAFDTQVLSESGSQYEPSRTDRLGGGGLRTFVFTAREPGRTTVRLSYRRPWETASQDASSFSVDIEVRQKDRP